MITQYHAIALSFGYVESNTTSWLVYKSEGKTPLSRRETLESLVAYLWDKYSKQSDEHHEFSLGYSYGNKCCQRHWLDTKYVPDPEKPHWNKKREVDPKACPTCKMEYPVTWTFDEERWKEYLFDLHHSDCNSYGEHDWPENPYGWTPWQFDFSIPQHQMAIVAESAENILTDVLYELHPELVTEEHEETWGPFSSDYNNLMDESCIYHQYHYDKPRGLPQYATVSVTVDYPNGAKSIMVDGIYTYSKHPVCRQGEDTIAGYDELWYEFKDGKYDVIKIRDYLGNEKTEWLGNQNHP